jgi:protoheme IX farnesyltransferase
VKNVRAGAAAVPLAASSHGAVVDYVSLTKPRLNLLVVATSAGGYYLGSPGTPDVAAMALSVAGTAFVAAGAAALNQLAERDTDALMRRTRTRALADRRLRPTDAGLFGIVLTAGGLALLVAQSYLAAALALATILIYVGVYTPLKRRTPLATLVGAVPGALPPLIGWAASHGEISAGGIALFAIVFFWQMPHFMAIAWMYRDDYAAAGFPMLSVVDGTGRRAGREAIVHAAALLGASVLPWLVGLSGRIFLVAAVTLGCGLLLLAIRFAIARTDQSARQLFFGSIAYLPALWIAMIVNRL